MVYKIVLSLLFIVPAIEALEAFSVDLPNEHLAIFNQTCNDDPILRTLRGAPIIELLKKNPMPDGCPDIKSYLFYIREIARQEKLVSDELDSQVAAEETNMPIKIYLACPRKKDELSEDWDKRVIEDQSPVLAAPADAIKDTIDKGAIAKAGQVLKDAYNKAKESKTNIVITTLGVGTASTIAYLAWLKWGKNWYRNYNAKKINQPSNVDTLATDSDSHTAN